ncbi:hypothetical protein PLICRDRAFT_33739 [Plicaturopsis crispa FD-325 SS-3]|nr:hypothetical protein PLICRDRAFT_33739 [Plicaturopsis crispa FD-325 SS-3]
MSGTRKSHYDSPPSYTPVDKNTRSNAPKRSARSIGDSVRSPPPSYASEAGDVRYKASTHRPAEWASQQARSYPASPNANISQQRQPVGSQTLIYNQYYAHEPSKRSEETAALLLKPRESGREDRFWKVLLRIVALLIVLWLALAIFREMQAIKDDSVDPAERERWERERNDHAREHEGWERERETREKEHERKRIEKERKQREQERQREEEERRQRMNLYWDTPVLASQSCHSYATREYTARLWNIPAFGYDWTKACNETPIHIHNVTIESPTWCENRGMWSGMHGHWLVDFNEPDCIPFWGDFVDKDCTAEGSGRHRVESRLWNVHSGGWENMCATTPATIHGFHYDKPTACDNRGIWGMYGIWEVEDPGC